MDRRTRAVNTLPAVPGVEGLYRHAALGDAQFPNSSELPGVVGVIELLLHGGQIGEIGQRATPSQVDDAAQRLRNRAGVSRLQAGVENIEEATEVLGTFVEAAVEVRQKELSLSRDALEDDPFLSADLTAAGRLLLTDAAVLFGGFDDGLHDTDKVKRNRAG
jgi:hypothetical protein